ncbi:MAG: hypothetical protein R3C49_25340 [Planctomycetaceae bacterium]
MSGHVFSSLTGRRVPPAAELVAHIRDLTTSLQECTAEQLQQEADSLRSELAMGADIRAPEMIVAGAALAAEAMRRAHGVGLYDVQLWAVVSLIRGRICQMQTGEGKTYVAITTAACLALHGKGVHVMTPNSYLAERDSQAAQPVLRQLNMTVGLTAEQAEVGSKTAAYDCDVTYGTGHEFGFDYLRDQLTLRKSTALPPGERLLRDLQTDDPGRRPTMQRGLIYGVVDEADSVLIDDAGSPLVLSLGQQGEAPDAKAHLTAFQMAEVLQPDLHFHTDERTGRLVLTTSGSDRCYADDVLIPTDVLLRPWTVYVEQALRARYLFRPNIHYVVVDGEVRIVDATTGRIFDDRSWQEGLHQAIEAREGLKITPEKEALAQITRQRFFRRYQNLCGMTGTALGCETELQQVYRCAVEVIPLRRPSARTMLPTRFFASRVHKFAAIVEEVIRRHTIGQPVLVGTQSITDSELISRQLQDQGLKFQLLNGLQTAEEAEIIAEAGRRGAVTISTNLAGRGTDIHVDDDALAIGGLHVIVAECQLSGRMDRQLIGRCGRQGNVGSAQIFVSADDTLLTRFGQWLSSAIRREAVNGETHADFTKALHRIQQTAEHQQFLGRLTLLEQDRKRS